jgi:hypothetical protein
MSAASTRASIEALLHSEHVGRFTSGQERPSLYYFYVALVAVTAVIVTRLIGIGGIAQYAVVGAGVGASVAYLAVPVIVAEVGADIVLCQSARWQVRATRVAARLPPTELAHLGGSWVQRWRIGSHTVHVSGRGAGFLRDALGRAEAAS